MLLGPDGKEIPKTLAVEYNGRFYPYRVVNQEVLNAKDPLILNLATLVQMGDQTNLIFLGMLCLAKDIYNPGSKEFLKFAQQLKLNIIDIERHEMDIATELNKTL